MARGLRIPLGVDNTGGAALLEGEEQARQIISTALSDLDNDNAFQQNIGLGSEFVYSIPNNAFRAYITQRIKQSFDRWERLKLFKLIRNSLKYGQTREGEHIVEFQYINLESDQTETFSRAFASRGS